MHFLLGLLVLGVLVYLLSRKFTRQAITAPASSALKPGGSTQALAYLANGLLFYREQAAAVTQLDSTYIQEALDRRERSRERNSWKKGTSFSIAAGGNSRSFEGADAPIIATAAAFEQNGDLLYFLKDEGVGGLFRRVAETGRELRVLLRQGLHLEDLTPAPDGQMLIAASRQSDGSANIALFKQDGSEYREITGGDSVDSAPAWIPGVQNRLLFQSSGIARNEHGGIVALGHASIQMLNMESGNVDTVHEDPRYDLLKPRVCPAGNLLFIRRPYKAQQYGPVSMLSDTLLFPFRLLRAVFHYLNFFSLMYTRKPLTSASGPAMQADLKSILLQGRRIDAEKALRSENPVHGVPSLVPSNWELVSRTREGSERTLASNVASYDLSPDGTITYSNGRGVFIHSPDGSTSLALSQDLIGEVFAAQT